MAKSLHTGPNSRAVAQQLRQVEHDHATMLARVSELRAQLAAVESLTDQYATTGAVPVSALRAAVEQAVPA